jgi:hypothetical protein
MNEIADRKVYWTCCHQLHDLWIFGDRTQADGGLNTFNNIEYFLQIISLDQISLLILELLVECSCCAHSV